jgi:NAD(P)-dependent dehydrogenase (short-subunit alcohol dehydrogenase family)
MQSKTILITGATSGIGLALAKQCVALGNQVIITGRNQTKLDQVASQLGVKAYLADSADLAQLVLLGEALQQDGIVLDGVVLNAGVFYPSSFVETTAANFDETIGINTKGPFFTLQALLPSLAQPASVVFISSIVVTKGFAGCSTYAASKAAFEATIRVLNIELADRGIRINSIRPGITATDIQAKAGMTKEQEMALFESLKATPVGRELNADDHLGAALYLLDDASLALRNAVIEVDGGYTL